MLNFAICRFKYKTVIVICYLKNEYPWISLSLEISAADIH